MTFFRLPVAAAMMRLPTGVEPVNAILSTSGWAASASPAIAPGPGTTLTTPAGKPASMISSPSRSAVSGVCSAGLNTTVFPAARAGPSFQAAISSGKFHGTICPTTPDGFPQRVRVVDRARGVGHRQRDGVALQLVRPAGHVVEQFCGQRHVHRAGHADRLAVVQGFQLGELLQVLEHQVTEPPDQPAPLGGRHPRPRAAFERPPGGPDRDVDVHLVALRAFGQQFTGGRVMGLEGLLGLAFTHSPSMSRSSWRGAFDRPTGRPEHQELRSQRLHHPLSIFRCRRDGTARRAESEPISRPRSLALASRRH